ncbi:MAG: pyruvate kinase [Acidimicrobiales bacterium]
MPRRTKIVATIGPASESPAIIGQLIDAGMDMARLSLAHGPLEETLERIRLIRKIANDRERIIGVMADLPGPKIRAASFPEGGLMLMPDSVVQIVAADANSTSDASTIAVDHPEVLAAVQPGDRVALGDGAIQLEIVETGDGGTARVLTGGWAQGRPGFAVPADRVSLPSPTPTDLSYMDALCEEEVDAIAISFVRSGGDIDRARHAAGPDAPMLVAKIETQQAVDDLDNIIATADGVMVARGDLGIRCAVEDVPHYQKRIIRIGVAFGRPVITATQLLESMVRAPTPTRAEVTDIANAVFDGSSALMLSGETAIGAYPVESVRTMARVARRAEQEFDYANWGKSLGKIQMQEMHHAPIPIRITAAISAAAWRASIDAEVTAIIACTNTGASARGISRFRPVVPVLAATPSLRTARQLSVAWGVTPFVSDRHGSTDDIVWFAVQAAIDQGIVNAGDVVAVLVGSPSDPEPAADTLRLVRVS